MKLAPRLSLAFLAAIALASALSIVLVRSAVEGLFRSYLHQADARRGNAYQALFEDYWMERGSWEGVQDRLMSAEAASGRGAGTEAERVILADAQGLIVADNMESLLGSVHPSAHLAQGIALAPGGARVGTLMVGSMADPSLSGANQAFLSSVTSILLWSSLASAAVALALGLALSAGVARPLALVNSAARRVASGDFSVRVDERGSGETAQLSASFNAMAAELARLDSARRRIIADAAHELRTPATLIRGTVEAILDGVYPADRRTLESLREETLRLCRLIEDLRELEALESGRLALATADIDLSAELRRSVAAFAPAAADKGVALEAVPSSGSAVTAWADPLRAGQVMRNLLANALAHAPAGGAVRASAKVRPDGSASIRVEDSGPGIPAAKRERIFERFYRIDPGHPGGSGLGLAIALEIMKAHGGGLAAGDSALGGAAFEAIFPARRP